ncbi:hypothetical protein BU23DRAFT_567308 [Bimuria novae-zelandiae CBS 107.79]|uniref:F-box domain-containing protein n=1 Tax=Bimuria novae-zelandiae CBS 107.79 TaxID=1447943 RepID=A0A6A5VM71_9PLEO|nr:hypothetical protein BU23DRAFT_567308 [Bimuria novae-zelandiae CBS 107.79]
MSVAADNPESASTLAELPAELLLEILQYLNTMRGYISAPEDEAARRAESAERISASHNLTLTCRRPNTIVIPFLYGSLIGIGTHRNTLSLMFPVPLLLDPGSSPASSCWLRIAQNLHSLGVHGAWKVMLVLPPQHNTNLRELASVSWGDNTVVVRTPPLSGTIYSPLLMFLCSKQLGFHVDASVRSVLAGGQGQLVPVEELILEGNWHVTDIGMFISKCKSLRRFHCRWTAAPEGEPINLAALRFDLRHLESSLESLILDTLDSTWMVELDREIPTIGSLHEFGVMKHLEVSGMVLWNDENLDEDLDKEEDAPSKQPPLSWILPPSLETLVINVEWNYLVEDGLSGLSKDWTVHLPNLKSIDCSWRPAPMDSGEHLTAEFEKVGVALKLDIAKTVEEEEARIEKYMTRMMEVADRLDEAVEAFEQAMTDSDHENLATID